MTNAASNLAGAVAPGELVVLYGTGLGGVQSVLFNGVAGRCSTRRRARWARRRRTPSPAGRFRWWCSAAGTASAPVAVAAGGDGSRACSRRTVRAADRRRR